MGMLNALRFGGGLRSLARCTELWLDYGGLSERNCLGSGDGVPRGQLLVPHLRSLQRTP